jgi:hypothetical protein
MTGLSREYLQRELKNGLAVIREVKGLDPPPPEYWRARARCSAAEIAGALRGYWPPPWTRR